MAKITSGPPASGGGAQPVLKTAVIPVTSAQILALNSSPVTVITGTPNALTYPLQVAGLVGAGDPYTVGAVSLKDSGTLFNYPLDGLVGALGAGLPEISFDVRAAGLTLDPSVLGAGVILTADNDPTDGTSDLSLVIYYTVTTWA